MRFVALALLLALGLPIAAPALNALAVGEPINSARTGADSAPLLPPLGLPRPLSGRPAIPLDTPFAPNVPMSDDASGGNQNEVTLAADMAGRLFSAWNDIRDGNDYRCGYSYSLDGGATWAPNQLYLDPNYEVAGDPVAAADAAGRTYLICMPFNRSDGDGTLRVLVSEDGGQTWIRDADIGVPGLDDKPWAAAWGDGVVHVVWDSFNFGERLMIRSTFDAGATWTPARAITTNGYYPGIDTDRYGRLHVVYAKGGSQWYVRSEDFGQTFTAPVSISATGNDCDTCSPRSNPIPQIASDPTGQNLYVVWSGDLGLGGGENVYLGYSNDGGSSWSRVRVNDDSTTQRQIMPSVDVDHDGIVHLLWGDMRSGNYAAYYANSTNAGQTISPNARASDAEAPPDGFMGDYQQFSVDDWGVAHLAWTDSRNGTADTYYADAALSTPGPHTIALAPANATVPTDQTLQYAATVSDPLGGSPADPLEWIVTSGAIDGAGLYDPGPLGDHVVRVYAGFRFNETPVHVVPGALATIVVSPPSADVPSGGIISFSVAGFDIEGNSVPLNASWEATGGLVDANGTFTGTAVGMFTVYVNESGVSGSASVNVSAGPLASIVVTPPSPSITADDTQPFTAAGFDAFGNPVPLAPTWAATEGSVDVAGLYTPAPVGTHIVYANQSGISGSAGVTVLAGVVAALVVSPATANITADDTQQLSVAGFDAKGNPVDTTGVAWSTDGGSVDAAGLYTPTPVGTWTVTATLGPASDTASVTVSAGALAALVVSPATANITADQVQQFTATGFDAKGNPVSISPEWTTDGGSIDPLGLYDAGPVGTWVVTATEGSVSGSANVTVTAGALASVVVSPPTATITADDTQPFTATGFDADGNPVAVAPSWGTDGGGVSPAGLYMPTRVGTWTVYANQSGRTGTASVTVTAGALAALVVSPPTATITADETQPFTAAGYDAKGNAVPIAPAWGASDGDIPAGRFIPRRIGTWTVYANQSGLSGTAGVTVLPGPVVRVSVLPFTATITVDETQQFTATAYDGRDNVVPTVFSWTAASGSVTASGFYTPDLLGTFSVEASAGGQVGKAFVTVVAGELARLEVAPPTAMITADETQRFTATAYDSHDNVLSVAVSWIADGGSVDASGLYTPSPVGTWTVTGSSGPASDTASVTVLPGTLASLEVAPEAVTITADDTQAFTATGFDAKGNPVSVSPAWSASGGFVSPAGVYAAGPAGTWTVTAGAGGFAATASVTVVPGAPASIAVKPGVASLRKGETQEFTALVLDVDGNAVAVEVDWSVDGGGVVDAEGRFESAVAGEASVEASVPGTALRDTATVTVAGDPGPRGPAVVPGAPWWVSPLVAAVIVALLLLFLLFRRRKGEREVTPPPPPPLPPPPGQDVPPPPPP